MFLVKNYENIEFLHKGGSKIRGQLLVRRNFIGIKRVRGFYHLYKMDDSDSVANTDLISKLSLLMDMGKKKTKYNVLNLNSKFTVDQKHTLEHVFDALYAKYTNAKANDIIQTIIDSF